MVTSKHHDKTKTKFKRSLHHPRPGTQSFFLWGPRQTGKSTLLRQTYADCRWIDLLKAEEFRRYLAQPQLLRQEIEAAEPAGQQQIVVDEIQKVPSLLDEVHWLIENRGRDHEPTDRLLLAGGSMSPA